MTRGFMSRSNDQTNNLCSIGHCGAFADAGFGKLAHGVGVALGSCGRPELKHSARQWAPIERFRDSEFARVKKPILQGTSNSLVRSRRCPKNKSLCDYPKSVASFPHPASMRGVRVVTDVECGMRWTCWR